jgi:hypothetical protein
MLGKIIVRLFKATAGYLVYIPATKKVVNSRDVDFLRDGKAKVTLVDEDEAIVETAEDGSPTAQGAMDGDEGSGDGELEEGVVAKADIEHFTIDFPYRPRRSTNRACKCPPPIDNVTLIRQCR